MLISQQDFIIKIKTAWESVQTPWKCIRICTPMYRPIVAITKLQQIIAYSK